MTLHLTHRDVATLVAALHAWQNELSCYTVEELRHYHPELSGHEPLTIAEVEGLLSRLQPAPGTGETTVSSVRPSVGGDR